MTVGLGLLWSQRWAWLAGLLAAMAGIVVGFLATISPGDITAPGAQIIGVVILLVPSLALGGALLQPRTLRWLREPREPVEDRQRFFE